MKPLLLVPRKFLVPCDVGKIRKTLYKGSINVHGFPTGAFLAVGGVEPLKKNNFHLNHLANRQ
jgi:DNA-binding transcriptional regulator WhiA